MSATNVLSLHSVLPAETRGDTLIVTPRGDLLSHDERTFRSELASLRTTLQRHSLRNLIVDLSGSDYFGSTMLGGLLALREGLPEDGRLVLCNVSPSQQVGLKILRIEDRLEIVASRRMAVRRVSRLSGRDYVRTLRRPLVALFFLGACWGLYESRIAYRVFGSGVKADYETVAHLWTQYRDGHPQGLTPEETRRWQADLSRDVAAARQELSGKTWYLTQDAYLLGEATAALDDIVQGHDVLRRFSRFRNTMFGVRLGLEERTGLPASPLSFDTSDLGSHAAAMPAGERGEAVQQVSLDRAVDAI